MNLLYNLEQNHLEGLCCIIYYTEAYESGHGQRYHM